MSTMRVNARKELTEGFGKSIGEPLGDYHPLFKEAQEFYPHFKIRMVPFESRSGAKVGKTAPQGQEGSASPGQVEAIEPIEPIEHLIQDAQGDTVF
ncbi:hypothetical protein HDU88_001583 [Geranomyces variabilis]|nr:hypothetical protein HDU88_001583 [Geranomyces variabilis]